MVGVHLSAAATYFGITFRFQDYNSRVFVAWYIIAILEVIVNTTLSMFWKVLSFRGTHLQNRMSLLTFIIIGEGIVVICTNITQIVINPDAWSKLL
jgi:low temperature requirement protein LtrA